MQVGLRGVEPLVAGEFSLLITALDQGQADGGAVPHRHRHGAVQANDRRGSHLEQQVITVWAQSVASAAAASPCTAAMAACNVYGPTRREVSALSTRLVRVTAVSLSPRLQLFREVLAVNDVN